MNSTFTLCTRKLELIPRLESSSFQTGDRALPFQWPLRGYQEDKMISILAPIQNVASPAFRHFVILFCSPHGACIFVQAFKQSWEVGKIYFTGMP